ncbi:MAG TPA: Asp23/Gls24 family envelope stress response protein [Chloroflexota bacterium]|nr:Asp23/Gls24 family envelope stress response protein [Chloroflexota bacterium]
MISEATGTIRIAPEVLATIVQLTARSVNGIRAMAETPHRRVLNRPTPEATRGVVVRVRDNAVQANLYVVVAHGANMVAVGNQVQQAVVQAVHEMLGMTVRGINVYIQGVE